MLGYDEYGDPVIDVSKSALDALLAARVPSQAVLLFLRLHQTPPVVPGEGVVEVEGQQLALEFGVAEKGIGEAIAVLADLHLLRHVSHPEETEGQAVELLPLDDVYLATMRQSEPARRRLMRMQPDRFAKASWDVGTAAGWSLYERNRTLPAELGEVQTSEELRAARRKRKRDHEVALEIEAQRQQEFEAKRRRQLNAIRKYRNMSDEKRERLEVAEYVYLELQALAAEVYDADPRDFDRDLEALEGLMEACVTWGYYCALRNAVLAEPDVWEEAREGLGIRSLLPTCRVLGRFAEDLLTLALLRPLWEYEPWPPRRGTPAPS